MEPILGGILLGGVLAFGAIATPGRVEKTAEKALRQKFPGAVVDVTVEGRRGNDVLHGRFKRVRVELSGARLDALPLQSSALLPTGTSAKAVKSGSIAHLELQVRDLLFGEVRVKSAQLSFDNVRYDFGALKKHSEMRLISFSNGKVALSVEAPALLPTFSRRAPEIVSPRVELRGGEAILSGRREFLGTSTDVTVRGPVVARGQNLELDGARVEVSGAPLPPALAVPILKDVNPLYAFDPEGAWPFSLRVETIRAENDVLEVEGAIAMK